MQCFCRKRMLHWEFKINDNAVINTVELRCVCVWGCAGPGRAACSELLSAAGVLLIWLWEMTLPFEAAHAHFAASGGFLGGRHAFWLPWTCADSEWFCIVSETAQKHMCWQVAATLLLLLQSLKWSPPGTAAFLLHRLTIPAASCFWPLLAARLRWLLCTGSVWGDRLWRAARCCHCFIRKASFPGN